MSTFHIARWIAVYSVVVLVLSESAAVLSVAATAISGAI